MGNCITCEEDRRKGCKKILRQITIINNSYQTVEKFVAQLNGWICKNRRELHLNRAILIDKKSKNRNTKLIGELSRSGFLPTKVYINFVSREVCVLPGKRCKYGYAIVPIKNG